MSNPKCPRTKPNAGDRGDTVVLGTCGLESCNLIFIVGTFERLRYLTSKTVVYRFSTREDASPTALEIHVCRSASRTEAVVL